MNQIINILFVSEDGVMTAHFEVIPCSEEFDTMKEALKETTDADI